MKSSRHPSRRMFVAAMMAVSCAALRVRAYDVSEPAILEDFENLDTTLINRMPDIFAAGYGAEWFPPPTRADSGNTSVGYDVYNRFDLGSPGNPTLYGTQAGLTKAIASLHTFGGSAYIDLVWNHSGFRSNSTSGFDAQGGYPGFAVTLQTTNPTAPGYNQYYSDSNGDYHASSATSTTDMQISGLLDIAQSVPIDAAESAENGNDDVGKDYEFIRQPTTSGNPRNIPAGTVANIPSASNAQFYPDQSLTPLTLSDPTVDESSVTVYPFNTTTPLNGDPVTESNTEYLMRYAQWLIQVIGADGFRVDAAKNMPVALMDYLDLAVYRESKQYYLNGQQKTIYSFQEVFDSSTSLLQSYVSKTITNPNSNTVGADRDVLDFPLYFALDDNLGTSGTAGTFGASGGNNWNNVVNASIDVNDDGDHNGSQGVKFVSSQDSPPPALENVAYAYTLMMPGQAIVYFNGHEFGTEAQRSFPQDGEEAALGGAYGTAITTLVDLRNRYGRGNYHQDWLEQNLFAFERQGSALVLLSNTNDTSSNYDSRTIGVHFAVGTPLVEQTGNAASTYADPTGVIPTYLLVTANSNFSTGASVNAKFLRNEVTPTGGTAYATGDGYLVYGLPTPTGSISLSNVSKVLAGTTPSTSDSNIAYENGTDRISNVDVITSSTFTVSLATTMNNIPGYGHWHNADGSQAMIMVDSGIDVAGTNGLDTTPTDATYGYENFATTNVPGYSANSGAGGNGSYSQLINTSQLGQGYHYISVIALSYNSDSTQPPVYTDWKQTIYVDTAAANSTIESFNLTGTASANRTLVAESVDGLANNIHVFLDLPSGDTNSQILAMIGSNNQPTQTDVNLWQENLTGVTSGNHVVTLVTYKPDGATTIQRLTENQYSFLSTSTTDGAGLGDLNYDGSYTSSDISTLTTVLQSNNQQFNPAADVNGDGVINLEDTFLLGPIYVSHGANLATIGYNSLVTSTTVTNGVFTVTGNDVIYGDTAATTSVQAGKNLTATYVRGNLLSIPTGSTVTITANTTGAAAGVSSLSTLTIGSSSGTWTGKLDLKNNDLLFESTSANLNTDYARLASQVAQGCDGGLWNGNGITSSSAAADAYGIHALGIALNSEGGSLLYSSGANSFDGLTADSNSILMRYTLYGDANLDGVVNGSDYTLLDSGFNNQLTGWYNGDFNYDGVINGNDYTLIDNAYNNQSGGSSAVGTAPTDLIATANEQIAATAVPEPVGLSALVLVPLLARRRRRSCAL